MKDEPKSGCGCSENVPVRAADREAAMDELARAIKISRAAFCYECGKCTGVCPVARYDRSFSPRSLLVRAVRDDDAGLLEETMFDAASSASAAFRDGYVNVALERAVEARAAAAALMIASEVTVAPVMTSTPSKLCFSTIWRARCRCSSGSTAICTPCGASPTPGASPTCMR